LQNGVSTKNEVDTMLQFFFVATHLLALVDEMRMRGNMDENIQSAKTYDKMSCSKNSPFDSILL